MVIITQNKRRRVEVGDYWYYPDTSDCGYCWMLVGSYLDKSGDKEPCQLASYRWKSGASAAFEALCAAEKAGEAFFEMPPDESDPPLEALHGGSIDGIDLLFLEKEGFISYEEFSRRSKEIESRGIKRHDRLQ